MERTTDTDTAQSKSDPAIDQDAAVGYAAIRCPSTSTGPVSHAGIHGSSSAHSFAGITAPASAPATTTETWVAATSGASNATAAGHEED